MSGTFGHESWSAFGMAARLAGVSMMLGITQFTVIPVPRTSCTGMPANFGLGMTTDTAIAAARLLFGGVLTQAPTLRVCLAHGGGTFALGADHVAFGTDFPLPVQADPAGAILTALDPGESAWLRDATATALLNLRLPRGTTPNKGRGQGAAQAVAALASRRRRCKIGSV
jgi:hypothetical protein